MGGCDLTWDRGGGGWDVTSPGIEGGVGGCDLTWDRGGWVGCDLTWDRCGGGGGM